MSSHKARTSRARRRQDDQGEEEDTSWSMSVLPCAIIMDILSRLPMKTIIQCRCVCKSWQSLLSDHYFARLHRERAPTTLLICSQHDKKVSEGVIARPDGMDNFYMVELESAGLDGVMKFKTKNNLPACHAQLVGSCNGLLCLFDKYSRKSFYLCNPMTGEYVMSPRGPKRQKQVGTIMNVVFGFGFSLKTNCYMVMRITKKKISHPRPQLRSEGEIYVFGTKFWKSIGEIPFPAHDKFFAIPLNGALHWIVSVDDYENSELICALDIDNENIRPILPPSGFRRDTTEMTLGVLGGCLFICDNMTFYNLEIWVMKNYGVEESWTKDIVIAKNSLPSQVKDCILQPIMISKDGEILISSNCGALVLYDPRRQSFTDVKIGRVGCEFEAVHHVVNFDSLKDIMKRDRSKDQYVKGKISAAGA